MPNAFGFRYPKTAVLIAAACFYVPFVADWCEPGPALHQAAVALGALPGTAHPYFWNKIVCLVGRNVSLLGTVSMVSAFVCALLVSFLAGSLMDAALCAMRRRVSLSDGEADEIRGRAEFLTALAFLLTPGFFHAATRIGPLHALLIPFLAGLVFLVLLLRLLSMGGDSPAERLKRGVGLIFLSLAFLFYATCEMALSRSFLQSEKLAFAVFSLIGILPLAVLTHLVRRRRLLTRRAFNRFFVLWALLVAGCGILSVLTAGRGRVASRVVRHIIDNARNCRAVVSDGALDMMFYFMLPESQRLILLSRDDDRDYGEELANWILTCSGERSDLFFAAELGPRALVDEWTRLGDQTQAGAILTPAQYFPTHEKWSEACVEISGMDVREPYGTYLVNWLHEAGTQKRKEQDLPSAARLREEVPARVQEFIKMVSVTPQTTDEATRLREMILKGLASGHVKLSHVSTQLLTLDLWLEDWVRAEKDAIDILRNDRAHRKANVVKATASASRSDYHAAAYYFRRALSAGGVGDDSAAKDLAFALARQGRADEAESFARQAVVSHPDDWHCRETLAFVLIRQGKTGEGEQELRQAILQAEQAGMKVWKIARFSLDCAWLYKVRGEKEKMESRLRLLSERGELTAAQWQEIKELER